MKRSRWERQMVVGGAEIAPPHYRRQWWGNPTTRLERIQANIELRQREVRMQVEQEWKIPLRDGTEVIVDAAVYEDIMTNPQLQNARFTRNSSGAPEMRVNGERVQLHRWIMDAGPEDHVVFKDEIDPDAAQPDRPRRSDLRATNLIKMPRSEGLKRAQGMSKGVPKTNRKQRKIVVMDQPEPVDQPIEETPPQALETPATLIGNMQDGFSVTSVDPNLFVGGPVLQGKQTTLLTEIVAAMESMVPFQSRRVMISFDGGTTRESISLDIPITENPAAFNMQLGSGIPKSVYWRLGATIMELIEERESTPQSDSSAS